MLKLPTKSSLLKQLESAQLRIPLTSSQSNQLIRESSGYEGECVLSQYFVENLNVEYIALYDLHLEENQKEFQIDCLLILQDEIYVIEVKHFRGEYEIVRNDWRNVHNGFLIETPLVQLNRAKRLFENLLKKMQVNLKVNEVLILTNEEFILFKSDHSKNVIMRQQLRRFVNQLNSRHSHLSDWHVNVSEKLFSRHIIESKYQQKLEFDFELMKKGMRCDECDGWLGTTRKYSRKNLYCLSCESKVDLETAVLKCINEYQLLFPKRKITVNTIFEWSGECVSCHMIRKVLNKYYIPVGTTKGKYYLPID